MENLFYKQSISQTYDLKGIGESKSPLRDSEVPSLCGRRTQGPESDGGWVDIVRQRVDRRPDESANFATSTLVPSVLVQTPIADELRC